jgi:hypothetical protein
MQILSSGRLVTACHAHPVQITEATLPFSAAAFVSSSTIEATIVACAGVGLLLRLLNPISSPEFF